MLYLLITAVLLNVFTYKFYSLQVESEQKRFTKFEKKMTDSLVAVSSKLQDATYFSLEKNQKAQEYFENATTGKFIPYEKLLPYVQNKLMDLNTNPNGNPYTGYDKIDGKKFIINKINVLNHRWIIADFNNGDIWGETLLKYFINDDETVSFEVIQSLVYQK